MNVRMKVILCLALGLVMLSGGAWVWGAKTKATRQQAPVVETQAAKNERIVREHFGDRLNQVKADRTNEIIRYIKTTPVPIRSIEQIVNNSSILRIKVIDREIVAEGDGEGFFGLSTWYKVVVLETIHQQDKVAETDSSLQEKIPARLLPVKDSEAIIVLSGGSITVDGVRIANIVDENLFALSLNQEYLMAADLGDKFIFSSDGSAGVYRIEKDTLVPLDQRENSPLVQEVRGMSNNDLRYFRDGVRLKALQKKN